MTGKCIISQLRVGGIVVSIAAFQAVDPGSIPGRRKYLFLFPSKHAKVENTNFFKSLKTTVENNLSNLEQVRVFR